MNAEDNRQERGDEESIANVDEEPGIAAIAFVCDQNFSVLESRNSLG